MRGDIMVNAMKHMVEPPTSPIKNAAELLDKYLPGHNTVPYMTRQIHWIDTKGKKWGQHVKLFYSFMGAKRNHDATIRASLKHNDLPYDQTNPLNLLDMPHRKAPMRLIWPYPSNRVVICLHAKPTAAQKRTLKDLRIECPYMNLLGRGEWVTQLGRALQADMSTDLDNRPQREENAGKMRAEL